MASTRFNALLAHVLKVEGRPDELDELDELGRTFVRDVADQVLEGTEVRVFAVILNDASVSAARRLGGAS